jgi:hypothetical protein
VRAAFLEIDAQGFEGGVAEGDDAFFVSFAADEDAAEVEREVAGRESGDFGDAQAAGVEQFQDGAVAQGGGAGLRAAGGWLRRTLRRLSSMVLTSDSARDLGRTFQALGESMLTVGSWWMRRSSRSHL